MPVTDLDTGIIQLKELLTVLLKDQRLDYTQIQVWGTPRRLVALVEDLKPRQPDRELVVKGPPANRAFDSDGKLTPAGEGFARSKGIEPNKLQIMDLDGGQYAAVVISEVGKTTIQILSEELPKLIAKIKFDKTMRWNESKVAFSRPIRWIVALFGDQVVPFRYASVLSGDRTRGLRFQQPEQIPVKKPADYFLALEMQGIVLNQEDRKRVIREQVTRIMQEAEGDVIIPEDLLNEVTNLVEAPTALRGEFDREHLDLPKEVLISVMKKHQRYFPIQKGEGLLPSFVVVRNGDGQFKEIVADGNAQVIRARFADAAFFIQEDLQKKLEDFLPRLDTLTFQVKLGSMLDKIHRIEQIVPQLMDNLQLSEEEKQATLRTAHLCKADLVTHMVVEMTSLQGMMGKFYAIQSGETEDVAKGIYEHYLPRYAGDKLPSGNEGLLVGIADRLDTLAGLFAVGLAPTGTKDPFAQRRAALGLVIALMESKQDFDLEEGLDIAAQSLPVKATPDSQKACFEFILGRLRSYLLDQGFRYDIVDSVLSAQGRNPAGVLRTVKSLMKWINSSEWSTILPAYSRCVRITRDQKVMFDVNPQLLGEPSEVELWDVIRSVSAKTPFQSFDTFIESFVPIIPAINRFFEEVMVMTDDESIRQNRLGLLQKIAVLPSYLADLSQMEGF